MKWSPRSCALRIARPAPTLSAPQNGMDPRFAISRNAVPLLLAGSLGRRTIRSAENSTRPAAFFGASAMSAIALFAGSFGSTAKYTFPETRSYPSTGRSTRSVTSTRVTAAFTAAANKHRNAENRRNMSAILLLFPRRVRTRCVRARADPQLGQFRNVPVLAVRVIPEFDCILGHEVRLSHLARIEVKLADDLGTVHRLWPKRVRHHEVRMQAEQEIGINRVVAHHRTLLRVEARQIVAPANAVESHGFSARFKSHTPTDVVGSRHLVVRPQIVRQTVEPKMHQRAMQTLVVIGNDQLPIRLHIIDDALIQLELAHAPGRKLFRQLAELREKRGPVRREIQKDVAVPHVARNTVQRIIETRKSGVHVRRADQLPIQPIG